MNKYRLVIIDDHADVLELLHYNLTREDYEVKDFLNPVDALQYITRENTDLVITDWVLPEMDVVAALELGAEEYIVKPVRMLELLTRVKKILGRQRSENKDVITRGGLTIDLPAYRAYINGAPLDLTIAEFRLLELLSRNPG